MAQSGSVILAPFQIRMARAALNWTIGQLAEYADVGERTIRRMESDVGQANLKVETYQRVVRCLESSGIVFIPPSSKKVGAGVCLAAS